MSQKLVFSATLLVAVAVVALLAGETSPRRSVLLAKATAAAAKPAAAVKAASAASSKSASPHHSSIVHLPPAILAAEKKQEQYEKEEKERILASAAKNAMQEYSSFRKEAKLALQQQNKRVKNLVSAAAKELIENEALEKQKAAQKKHEEGFWGDYKKKSKKAKTAGVNSAAAHWRAQMKAAEKAALDVIEKTDHAAAHSAEAWKVYADRQKAKIASVAKHEAALEKKQEQHIKKLVQDGKLKATTPLHIQEAKKQAKPLTAIQKAALAKKQAISIANRELAKESADVKSKVRAIAQKELPQLESHLKNEVNQMESRKNWNKLERAAAAKEKSRESSWKKIIHGVHNEVATKRAIESASKAAQQEKNALLQQKIKAATVDHLKSEVNAIIGHSVAGKKVAAALRHVQTVKTINNNNVHAAAAKRIAQKKQTPHA